MNSAVIPHTFTYEFSLADVQAVAAGAMGFDLRKQHLADILRPQLADPHSTLSTVLRRKSVKVDVNRLLGKLEALEPQRLRALQEAIGLLMEMKPQNPFGEGFLPSAHILRVAGLVAPTGAPAWGYCPILLDRDNHVHEVVLRGGPGKLKVPDAPIEELAHAAVRRVREFRDGLAKSPDALLAAVCYSLARATGERFLRVQEDVAGGITVVPIPIAALQRDVMDGSLRGLVLPGVNAPLGSGDI